jgi:very-short-patch-repair endonuclease
MRTIDKTHYFSSPKVNVLRCVHMIAVLHGERVGVRGNTFERSLNRNVMRGPDQRKVRVERRLRRNPTDAERKLWFALRDRRLGGFKFVRQEAIGPYIVDFVCREKRLIIEVDGGQHAENRRDRMRDSVLTAEGYHVLRFWNSDVLRNRDGVLSVIVEQLEKSATGSKKEQQAPHPNPLTVKNGERERTKPAAPITDTP